MQVHQYFDYHSRRFPENDCLIFQGKTYSYQDMQTMSQQIANGLLALGVKADDRVAVLCENCPEFLGLLMACSRIGAVTVPLNYRLAPPETAFILEDSKAHILLSPDEAMNPLLEAMAESTAKLQTVISCTTATNWQNWLAQQSAEPVKVDTYQQKGFLQLYTSGTTGKPKGVVLSHANISSLFTKSLVSSDNKTHAGSRDLVCAPPFHIGGSGTLLLPILAGGSAVLHKTFDPFAVVNDLEKYKIESSFIVPAMILAIISMVPDLDKRDFSSLKQIMYGASPISPALLEQAINIFGCDFYQAYGMTETTGTIVVLMPEDHRNALKGRPELLESAGRPQAGVEVKVVDSEGNILPPGQIGELYVRSESTMLGYYNRPDANAETFEDGWLKTGDSAEINEEGYIFLRDRIKDMIVSGAENIYPIEIENALCAHPAIADLAVIGIPDEKFGETPLACLVLKPGQSIETEEMIEFLRGKLAGYKIPRQLKIYDVLPRNPSGKILKKDLRAPFWEGRERQIN
ncbi:long-chain-fatty-acid--CoA ligase [Spongiibacter sp. KMU-158]|uniref:Long-chain-fatty-acid--CoA ligase n=1 Tax=Spongiibacter pelagi TaxID=2760804 RepID=A0A927C327_9GAMM|nr:long-chain-fatty-acid--CoA ligase [Spongiibacter pelagi]MBD2858876.1 long-chain-fatty-acid--CoA ligase [Spongiibacter pelagi]